MEVTQETLDRVYDFMRDQIRMIPDSEHRAKAVDLLDQSRGAAERALEEAPKGMAIGRGAVEG